MSSEGASLGSLRACVCVPTAPRGFGPHSHTPMMVFCQCRRTDVIVLYAPGYTNITRKRNFLAITAR